MGLVGFFLSWGSRRKGGGKNSCRVQVGLRILGVVYLTVDLCR